MKPFAHIFQLALGLSVAGLWAGCASSDYRTADRIEPANDLEVVETSARRPLTDREMAELRGTVARYLEQQGETGTGDYYLKVYLTPETEGITPEWVVVRFTRYSDVRVNVASASPGYDYPYSPSYYSYDTYPYGYDSFGRISFQYYDDPFYGRRYYYPRHEHRKWDRDHDHHRPGDHDHDHQPGDHRPPGGVVTTPTPPRPENPRRRNPDRIAPSSQPQPERIGRNRRDEDHRGAPGRSETAGVPSHPTNPAPPPQRPQPDRPQWRGRNENTGNAHTPRPASPPRAEARNETRTYTPPPRIQPEQRSAPASNNSGSSDRREVRDDGKRSGNQP
jgi:hypothetical protein